MGPLSRGRGRDGIPRCVVGRGRPGTEQDDCRGLYFDLIFISRVICGVYERRERDKETHRDRDREGVCHCRYLYPSVTPFLLLCPHSKGHSMQYDR